MVRYLGSMNDSYIRLYNEHGDSQEAQIIGAFKNQKGYYIVLRVEEDGSEENVMYRVEKREDGSEYIQVIVDREEWDAAYKSWMDLTYESMRLEKAREI